MRDKIQGWILKMAAWMSEHVVAHLHIGANRKLITGLDYYALRDIARPGDVILTRTAGEVSNMFIPGFWSHAAIVGLDPRFVIEAVTHGVQRTDMVSFCISKDYMALYRPTFATSFDMQRAAEAAEEQVGKPYQYNVEASASDIKAFYCSELILYCYKKVLDVMPFKLMKTLGRYTAVPSDIHKAKDKWMQMWSSESMRKL